MIYKNKKFKTQYTYSQIFYQVSKLMDGNFGKPDKDAELLLKEIEEEIRKNGGVSRRTISNTNHLRRVLFVSGQMLRYAEKFLDIVIVDATYKRNRFNMPLINILGVNNFGRNIVLRFALMDDEKADSYN